MNDQAELDQLFGLAKAPEVQALHRPIHNSLVKIVSKLDADPEVLAGLSGLCLACVLATFEFPDEAVDGCDPFHVTRLVMYLVHNTPYGYSDWLHDVHSALVRAEIPDDIRMCALSAFRAYKAYLLHLGWLKDRPDFLVYLDIIPSDSGA